MQFVPVLNPEKDKRFKTAQKNKFQQNEHKENGNKIVKLRELITKMHRYKY